MLTDILPCFFSLLILIYHHDLWAKIVIIYEVCVFVYLFFQDVGFLHRKGDCKKIGKFLAGVVFFML